MKVEKSFLRALAKIAGKEHVYSQPEVMIAYSGDASPVSGRPDAVVHPGSVEEVVAIVNAAAEAGVPLIARGAGTGLSGGSVAIKGGVVLHFDRMNRLREISAPDMVAEVEPGTVNWDLKRLASESGLFYPPDPGSMRVSTIGGNVAENAGGPYALKYGATGDFVLGVEVVTAAGEVIRTGGRSLRNVAGYDLTALMTGSEGTLGIITGITLRLLPQPPGRSAALFVFEDAVAAGEAVLYVFSAGIMPAAVELIDKTALGCANRFRPSTFPGDAGALLLIELDGPVESVREEMERTTAVLKKAGGRMYQRAEGEAAESVWEARRVVSGALGQLATAKIGEDVTVPLSGVPVMLGRIRSIAEKHGLPIAVFGHAGVGTLHPNILADRRDPEMMQRAGAAVSDIFSAALELGGTLSGEHGIGSAKAPYMKSAHSRAEIDAMLRIKQAFDPQGIMNPGKIFPLA